MSFYGDWFAFRVLLITILLSAVWFIFRPKIFLLAFTVLLYFLQIVLEVRLELSDWLVVGIV